MLGTKSRTNPLDAATRAARGEGRVIIFDLDGTLALIEHRRHFVEGPGPKNWPAFFKACAGDLPNEPVVKIFLAMWRAHPAEIEIWSGRSDEVRVETELWLDDHVGLLYGKRPSLRMRTAGDHTPDHVLKERWLDETLALGHIVEMVFDDRNRLVEMWRRRGIACLQVADGNF